MLFREIHTYKRHYVVLILGLALLLTLFVTQQDHFAKIAIAAGIGFFYTVWGILSHKPSLLTGKLMVEYALIGTIGAFILVSIISNI